MAEIGAYDAKTHLPKLLERVEKGERFVITRHGKPVAELRPVTPDTLSRQDAARRMREFMDRGGRASLTAEQIKALIEEGRD